jgi:alpha-1,2-mannosyltransferase
MASATSSTPPGDVAPPAAADMSPSPASTEAVAKEAGDGGRGGWLALAAAAAVFALMVALRYHRVMADATVDLKAYQGGVRAMFHGGSLYAHRKHTLPFTYPPFAAFVLWPLNFASLTTARAAMALASLVSSVVIVEASLRLALGRGKPRIRWAMAIAAAPFAILLEPVASTYNYGQVDLILLALLLTDLSVAHRRFPQGVLTGIAAAVKLQPALFIVYFALTRRFKAAAVATGVFVGSILLSFVIVPRDARRYWTVLVFDTSRVGRPAAETNQSIAGSLARLTHNAHWAHSLWYLLAALTLCGGLAVAARLYRQGQNLWAVCACGLTGLAAGPISWDHHWVWVVPISVALACSAATRRSAWLGLATLAWCLLFWAAPIWRVPYKHAAVYHQHGIQHLYSVSFILAGLVVLAALGVWALRRPVPADRASG